MFFSLKYMPRPQFAADRFALIVVLTDVIIEMKLLVNVLLHSVYLSVNQGQGNEVPSQQGLD